MDGAVSDQKVLKGNIGRTYRLLELLGDGLTAQVFRAQADNPDEEVAIKVLRAGLDDTIVNRFASEHRNVADVWAKLQEAADERTDTIVPNSLDDSPATPPRSFEFCPARPEQPAFVAMELMLGRKVEWLLAEQGAFAELLGLRLGLQLFGMLHVLHGRMKRSYDDFKFENLWWEAEAQRLRVTDWNVLGEEKDFAVKAPWDLERGARALLRGLTGVPLRLELRLDQQPRWSQLSVGAQALLKRMIDVDKARRPQTADEVCKELRLLIGYWLIEPGRGLRNAEAALDGIAEDQDAATLDEETLRRVEPTVRQTLAALSVLHLRHQQDAATAPEAWPADLVQRLDALQARAEQYVPSPERMVNTALSLLEGSSFPAAAAKLSDAVQLFPDHLPAHRWLELAESMAVGKALAGGENIRWRNAISRCDARDFDAANQLLAKLPDSFAAGLRGEVAVHLAVKQAQGDSTQINQKSQQVALARSALAKMRDNRQSAYASAVQEGLGIDLGSWEESLKKQAEAEQRRAQATEEASRFTRLSTPSSVEKGVERAEERLHLFLDEPAVVKAVLQLGERCLEAKQYHLAARAFYTGAVLDHDHAPAFRLRWLVAHAAYLQSVKHAQAGVEVEHARSAILAARQSGDLESSGTLDALWKLLAPSRQSLDTASFAGTLKEALKRDETGVIAVVGEQLDASSLASALDDKLKQVELSRLDSRTKTALDAMVQTYAGLSPAVLMLLRRYNERTDLSLSNATGEEAANREIAKAIGMPNNIRLIEVLLQALPPDERVRRANTWSQMAIRCGAGSTSGAEPRAPSKAATAPISGPSTTRDQPGETLPAAIVEASTPSASPLDPIDPDLISEALNSDDPRRWEQVIKTPSGERLTRTPSVTQKTQQRTNEISKHRTDMDRVLSDLDRDPVMAKENLEKWRQGHPRWSCCWDPRKQDWVEVGTLEREVKSAADTSQAQKWLQQAQLLQKLGKPPFEVKEAADSGMAFTQADPAVIRQLDELRQNPTDATQSAPGSQPSPSATRPTIDTIPPNAHPPDSLHALLERPIRESKTLSELYNRMLELMKNKPAYDSDIKKRLSDLQAWTKQFEAALTDAEKLLRDGRPLDERTKTNASTWLRNLTDLTESENWKPYIPESQETVFTLTKTRLKTIARSRREVAYHTPPPVMD